MIFKETTDKAVLSNNSWSGFQETLLESLIPENHLLRKIDRTVCFDFIYDLLAPYYPAIGRPSIDPVSMFKMLLIGYLYGVKSERRLVKGFTFSSI